MNPFDFFFDLDIENLFNDIHVFTSLFTKSWIYYNNYLSQNKRFRLKFLWRKMALSNIKDLVTDLKKTFY